ARVRREWLRLLGMVPPSSGATFDGDAPRLPLRGWRRGIGSRPLERPVGGLRSGMRGSGAAPLRHWRSPPDVRRVLRIVATEDVGFLKECLMPKSGWTEQEIRDAIRVYFDLLHEETVG